MKKLLSIISLFALSHSSIAQCRLNRDGWKIVFQEEFDGPKTDLDTRWYYGEYMGTTVTKASPVCGGSQVYGCNSSNQVNIVDGLGLFSVKKMPTPFICDGKVATHEFSGLTAKFDEFPTETPPGFADRNGFVFGMFEIRCKLTKRGATYPSFWLSGNSWPPEIDIFEYHGGAKEFFSTTHWAIPGGKDACLNFYKNTSVSLNDDFHTWTMVWTPTTITMFLDGVEYYSYNNISNIPAHGGFGDMWDKMHLIVGNGYYCGDAGTDAGVYDDFIVDYIRVYKPSPYRSFNPAIDTRASFFAQQQLLYNTTPFKTDAAWVHNVVYANDNLSGGLIGYQGGGKYKYRGPYNLLWCTYWSGGKFHNYAVDWSHRVDDNICVAYSSTGTETTFYRRGKNIWIENGSFNTIPTVSDVSYDVLCNSDGSTVYYRNTNGRICYVTNSGSGWTAPTALYLPGSVFTKIMLSARVNTAIYHNSSDKIYYITNMNQIAECNKASGLLSLPGGVNDAFSNLVISPSGDQLFYISVLGKLKTLKKVGGIWSTASTFVVRDGSIPKAVTGIKGRSLIVSPDPANLQLFFVDFTDIPNTIYWDKTTSNYKVANNITTNVRVKGDFKLVRQGMVPTTKTLISFQGYDNLIHTISWESPCGKPAECGSTTALLRSADKVEASDQMSGINFDAETISIAPNPTSGMLKLSNLSGKALHSIEIFSLDGKSVYYQEFSNGVANEEVNISHLAEGLYVCRIYSTFGESKTIKLQKNN